MLRKLLLALLAVMALFAVSATPASAESLVQVPTVDRFWSNQIPPNGYKTMAQYFTVNQMDTVNGWFDMTQFQMVDSSGTPIANSGGYMGWQSQLCMPNGCNQTGVLFTVFNGLSASNTGCSNYSVVNGSEGGVPFVSFHCALALTVGHRYFFYAQKDSPTSGFVRFYYYDTALTSWHPVQLAVIYTPAGWTGFRGWNREMIEHYSGGVTCPAAAAIAAYERPYVLDWNSAVIYSASSSPSVSSGSCVSHTADLGGGTYRLTAGA